MARSDLYPENGYITGTIQCKRLDGTPYTKDFKHELDLETASYFVNQYGFYVITLQKFGKIGMPGDTINNRSGMTFWYDNAKGRSLLMSYNANIIIDSTKAYITKLAIGRTPTTELNSIVLSNSKLDVANGTFESDYVITIDKPYTSSQRIATITGKIKTKLINIRYRTGS